MNLIVIGKFILSCIVVIGLGTYIENNKDDDDDIIIINSQDRFEPEEIFKKAEIAFINKRYSKTLTLLKNITTNKKAHDFIIKNYNDIQLLNIKASRMIAESLHDFNNILSIFRNNTKLLNSNEGKLLYYKLKCQIALGCTDYDIESPKRIFQELEYLFNDNKNLFIMDDEFKEYRIKLLEIILINEVALVKSSLKHSNHLKFIYTKLYKFISDYENIIKIIDNQNIQNLFDKLILYRNDLHNKIVLENNDPILSNLKYSFQKRKK